MLTKELEIGIGKLDEETNAIIKVGNEAMNRLEKFSWLPNDMEVENALSYSSDVCRKAWSEIDIVSGVEIVKRYRRGLAALVVAFRVNMKNGEQYCEFIEDNADCGYMIGHGVNEDWRCIVRLEESRAGRGRCDVYLTYGKALANMKGRKW